MTMRVKRGTSILAGAIVSTAVVLGTVAVHSLAGPLTPLPPRAGSSIRDAAGVIDDAAEARLEALGKELMDKTGVVIVILTVPRLEDETIDQLAVRAGQEWGVGKADQDRGMVVAFALAERRIFVATGYGTDGYLPDGRVGRLIDEHAMPQLRAGRISQALLGLAAALAAASAQEYGVTLTGAPVSEDSPERSLESLEFVFAVLAMLIAGYLLTRHPALFWFLIPGRAWRRGSRSGGLGGRLFRAGRFGGGGAGRRFRRRPSTAGTRRRERS